LIFLHLEDQGQKRTKPALSEVEGSVRPPHIDFSPPPGQDVEITVRPTRKPHGEVFVVVKVSDVRDPHLEKREMWGTRDRQHWRETYTDPSLFSA